MGLYASDTLTPNKRAERDAIVADILSKAHAPVPTLRSQLVDLDTEVTRELYDYLYDQGRKAVVHPLLEINRRQFDATVRPKPDISAVDLLERHRRMDGQGAKPGEFRVSNQEASRGPLMAITEPGVRTITVVCSPQMFKTLLVEAAICYYSLVEPSPMLVVEPTDNLVKQLVNWKVNKMIAAMPILDRAIVKSTTYYKSGPGFHIIFTNSGSDANLGMNTLRVIICDEIDKYLMTRSGPARILAEERASTYRHLARFIRTCTPTTVDGDIWRLFLAGDQRHYFIECPSCGHDHVPEFEVRRGSQTFQCVQWDNDGTGRAIAATAHYVCPNPECCPETGGYHFSEAERMVAIRKGIYRQTRHFRCANEDCDDNEVQNPVETRSWDHETWPYVGYATCRTCHTRQVSNEDASFQVWRIHSMLHDAAEIAKKSPQREQDPQAWANNIEARPYVGGDVSRLEAKGLLARLEMYDRVLSDRIVYATAGIDVQKTYIAVMIIGWGRGGEAWLIDYIDYDRDRLTGNPLDWSLWRRVDHILRTPYQTTSGRGVMVEAASIDTGGFADTPDMIYEVASRFRAIKYYPLKGRSESGKPPFANIYTPRSGENESRRPYLFGTYAAKELSLRALATAEVGPRFLHIGASMGDGSKREHMIHRVLDMLTAEERNEHNGRVQWTKLRVRNEAWDTFGYARHAKIAFEAETGFDIDKKADLYGIPRQVPEHERRIMDDNARAETAELLKQLDAKGTTALKPQHSRPRRMALPTVYRKGQGFQQAGGVRRR